MLICRPVAHQVQIYFVTVQCSVRVQKFVGRCPTCEPPLLCRGDSSKQASPILSDLPLHCLRTTYSPLACPSLSQADTHLRPTPGSPQLKEACSESATATLSAPAAETSVPATATLAPAAEGGAAQGAKRGREGERGPCPCLRQPAHACMHIPQTASCSAPYVHACSCTRLLWAP